MTRTRERPPGGVAATADGFIVIATPPSMRRITLSCIGWGSAVMTLVTIEASLCIIIAPFVLAAAIQIAIDAATCALRRERRVRFSDAGVEYGRIIGRAALIDWALLESARLELREHRRDRLDDADSVDRWRLTLVNMYKPSISAYLHRRGSDHAIFCYAIEFEFEAAQVQADALRDFAADRIATARRDFSALRCIVRGAE